MLLTMIALQAAAIAPGTSRRFVEAARSACAAPVGERPTLRSIKVDRLTASPGDLPALRVTDQRSGGWLLVYYDAGGEGAAYARAACLGVQIRLLARALGAPRLPRQWFSTVFTTDPDYVAPAQQVVTRWKIPLEADGRFAAQTQPMLLLTLPHEQVHSFQSRAGAHLPRWLEEGHAEWIGHKVAALLSPPAEEAEEQRSRRSLMAHPLPVHLGSWGAIRVRREAIMRQVPEEERRKMEADPAYTAPLSGRSFSFGPADMTSDESNLDLRYAAAWQLFRDLEAEHGKSAVQSWVDDLTKTSGSIDNAMAVRTADAVLHEQLSQRLD
ncbi:hypothetical protein F4693_003165 [Sphingomonas endophytica]|uniref:Uncharacterized protein n=1 Tax=Sphingomonas endophytica TaxID=869719 RepID=A0A7X0JEJ6_9SPHN|nr:hypothetical protein [Sphingomonas endophytica]MBB6506168.1 hypothetical protein [Sphingomonas endophytica]